MHSKYKAIVPIECQDDALYEKPPQSVIDAVKVEKASRATFKKELNVEKKMSSGIELRWWLEQLLRAFEAEGCKRGPAFGHRDGTVASMSKYNDLLHFFLRKVQEGFPDLILPDDNIKLNYNFSRTFRRTAEGRARAAQLDSSIQNAMNRWRKIEEAKGKRPRFNMADHYLHARQLMPVTWRYSFLQ
jgi:hypothetical protein